jgi:hypothetical protein
MTTNGEEDKTKGVGAANYQVTTLDTLIKACIDVFLISS